MRARLHRATAATSTFWIALVCAASGLGQAPDLSGAWVIDKVGPDLSATGILDVALSMEQRGTTLSYRKTLVLQGGAQAVREFTATIGGEPVKVKGRYVDELAVSCRHENGRLVIQREQDGIRIVGGKKETVVTNLTEAYSLSPDGQTLTVTETSRSGDRTRTTEMVFRRRK